MKFSRLLMIVSLMLVGALFITACSSSDAAEETEAAHMDEGADDAHADDGHADDEMGMDMDHAHVDPPDDFADLTNPLTNDAETLDAGKTVFDLNCSTCHGPEGMGDGPAAVALDPAPATLADGEMIGMLSDGYLFWRVTKGGAMEPFNSAMPTWEQVLTEEQRWQVITYVRSLGE